MSLTATVGEASSVFHEVHVEWKVRDILKLSDKTGDRYYSPVFSFANEKWYIKMHPNGEQKNSTTRWLGLYLMRKGSRQPRIVYFTLGFKSSKGELITLSRELKWKFLMANGLGYGSPRFCSRSYLFKREKILFPNNVLTIACCLRSERSSVNVALESFRKLLVSGDDSDVVLKVQGKEFPVHRAILRARSPVFWSMFQHDMAEKQSNVVNIEDIDGETFQDFLVHVYSGSCEQISTENVFSLFTTADKYDMGELRGACVDFMERNLSVANFYDVLALAKRYSEQELIETVMKFFCNNSLVIVKTAEWQIFLKENSTVANELIIKLLSK